MKQQISRTCALILTSFMAVGQAHASLTLRTITIDGQFDDWTAVMNNPLQVSFDGQAITCPPGRDWDCGKPNAGRDLRNFAWTYDQDYVYVYLERFGSSSNTMHFFFIMDLLASPDTDGIDPNISYLSCDDRVFHVAYQGSNGSVNTNLCRYRPAGAADCPSSAPSDPSNCDQVGGCPNECGNTSVDCTADSDHPCCNLVPYGAVDGFSVIGGTTECVTVASNAGGADMTPGPLEGRRFEARIPWSMLPVPAGSNIVWHVASRNNTTLSGAYDNMGGPDGNLGSFSFVDFTFAPNNQGGSASPGSVWYGHVLENFGNVPRAFNFRALSSLGLEVRIYEDPNADGNPTTGALRLLAIDANGDGDFDDFGDTPPATGDDLDGDGYPDSLVLAQGERFGLAIQIIVPPGFDNDVDTTRIISWPMGSPTLTRQVSNTSLLGSLVIGPAVSVVGTGGDVVNFRLTARNNSVHPQTVDLTALSNEGWDITLYEDCNGNGVPTGCSIITSTGELASGAQTTFIVQVSIPGGTGNDIEDTITVTGTSVETGAQAEAKNRLGTAQPLSASPTEYNVSSVVPNTLLFSHVLTNATSQPDTVTFSSTRDAGSTCAEAAQIRVWSDPNGDGSIADGEILWSGSINEATVPLAPNGGDVAIIVEMRVNDGLDCTEIHTITATATHSGAIVVLTETVALQRLAVYRDILLTQPANTFTICEPLFAKASGLSVAAVDAYRFDYFDSDDTLVRSETVSTDTRGEAFDNATISANAVPGSWRLDLVDTPSATLNFTVELNGTLNNLSVTGSQYPMNTPVNLVFSTDATNNNAVVGWQGTSLRYVVHNPSGTRYLDWNGTWQDVVSGSINNEYTGERFEYDVARGTTEILQATATSLVFEEGGMHSLTVSWRVECGREIASTSITFSVVNCVDLDGDGFGVGPDCLGPDCDDTDASCFEGCTIYYPDMDGDGFGNDAGAISRCSHPGGNYVTQGGDCNDNTANCTVDCTDDDADGYCVGHDCDDNPDTGASCFENCEEFYRDLDGDGYGDAADTVIRCEAPDGYVDNADDCDDTNPNCTLDCTDLDGDGYCVGHDCDDTVATGPACSAACEVFYLDADQDGYGDPEVSVARCEAPPGYVDNGDDCNDNEPLCTTDCTACAGMCGDGSVDPDEECDDGNNDDGDGCSAICTIEPGYSCTGSPSDCQPVCGNEVLNPGEECDDGNLLDGDGCSSTCRIEAGYICTGMPSVCVFTCSNEVLDAGEQCDDGNLLDGDGCSANCQVEDGYACTGEPSVCTLLCGNGVLDPGEECDDGNTVSHDGCSRFCQIEPGYACTGEPSVCLGACGNGELNDGEECDDGNIINGDGCSNICRIEPGYACVYEPPSVCTFTCGNSELNAGEECDDGNTLDGDGCSSTCHEEWGYVCIGEPSDCQTVCGDGIVAGLEECDDGTGGAGAGCSNECLIEDGYACTGSPSVCLPACGNGVLDPGEQCDDNNDENGDGCSSTCQLEAGFVCQGAPSVCVAVCGDGLVRGDEACDDGNLIDGDGCSSQCEIENGWNCAGEPSTCDGTCGDGIIVGAEECDDGNTNDGDGCSSRCEIESGWACSGEPSLCDGICGDGHIVGSEECDDGNTNDGDGCSSQCEIENGWNCVSEPSECSFMSSDDGHDGGGSGEDDGGEDSDADEQAPVYVLTGGGLISGCTSTGAPPWWGLTIMLGMFAARRRRVSKR